MKITDIQNESPLEMWRDRMRIEHVENHKPNDTDEYDLSLGLPRLQQNFWQCAIDELAYLKPFCILV
jgi:hypothetical protein